MMRRDRADELLAVQEEAKVGIVEDMGGAGGTEGCAGDDDRLVEPAAIGRHDLLRGGVDRPATVEEVGEQMAELEIDLIGGCRVGRRRRWGRQRL